MLVITLDNKLIIGESFLIDIIKQTKQHKTMKTKSNPETKKNICLYVLIIVENQIIY